MPGRPCALYRETTPGRPACPDRLRLQRPFKLIRAVAPRPHPLGTHWDRYRPHIPPAAHPPQHARGGRLPPYEGALRATETEAASLKECAVGQCVGSGRRGRSAAGRGGARGPARCRRSGGMTEPSFRGRHRQSLSGSVVIIGSRGVRGPPRLDVVGAVPGEAL